jgi:hypothetical protein
MSVVLNSSTKQVDSVAAFIQADKDKEVFVEYCGVTVAYFVHQKDRPNHGPKRSENNMQHNVIVSAQCVVYSTVQYSCFTGVLFCTIITAPTS